MTFGLWAQDKDRFKTDRLLNLGGNLLLDAAPFGIGKIAKIGSNVRKADTLMQMASDDRGWQAAVRIKSASISLATGVGGAVSLATGTNAAVKSFCPEAIRVIKISKEN